MKTQIDTRAPWYPAHLQAYTYQHGDAELLCFLDFAPGDRSVGLAPNAWLVHAYAGGVDVAELLKDAIIKDIESEAACSLSSD